MLISTSSFSEVKLLPDIMELDGPLDGIAEGRASEQSLGSLNEVIGNDTTIIPATSSGSCSATRVGVKRKLCVTAEEVVEGSIQNDASKKVKTDVVSTPLQIRPQDDIDGKEEEGKSDDSEGTDGKTLIDDQQNDRNASEAIQSDGTDSQNDADDEDDFDSDSEISEAEAERLRQTIADLKEECARLTEERRRIEEEEEKRRRERDRLAAEIIRVKAEFVRLKAECDRLKRHLAKQEEEIARLRLYLMIAREIKKKATSAEE